LFLIREASFAPKDLAYVMSLCVANQLCEFHPFLFFLYQERPGWNHGFGLCLRQALLRLICVCPVVLRGHPGFLACFRQFSFANQFQVFGVFLLELKDLLPIIE
jgi:hypothetical protein